MNAPLANLGKALMAARSEFRRAEKDSRNPHLGNRFASLDAVLDACEDALTAHGLTYTQPIVVGSTGPALRTVLIHLESGESIDSECPLLCEGNKGVNAMQALGSAVSYARRYSLESLLGIRREDDDAERACPRNGQERRPEPPPVTPTRQAARPTATNGTGATGGKASLMDWFVRKATAMHIHHNQLIHHVAKVAEADGYDELAKIGDPRAKVQWFVGCLRGETGPAWREWLKGQVETYRADLEKKTANGSH